MRTSFVGRMARCRSGTTRTPRPGRYDCLHHAEQQWHIVQSQFDLEDRRPAAWAVSAQPVRRCDLAVHDPAPPNTWSTNAVQTPFGGWKNRGTGGRRASNRLTTTTARSSASPSNWTGRPPRTASPQTTRPTNRTRNTRGATVGASTVRPIGFLRTARRANTDAPRTIAIHCDGTTHLRRT